MDEARTHKCGSSLRRELEAPLMLLCPCCSRNSRRMWRRMWTWNPARRFPLPLRHEMPGNASGSLGSAVRRHRGGLRRRRHPGDQHRGWRPWQNAHRRSLRRRRPCRRSARKANSGHHLPIPHPHPCVRPRLPLSNSELSFALAWESGTRFVLTPPTCRRCTAECSQETIKGGEREGDRLQAQEAPCMEAPHSPA